MKSIPKWIMGFIALAGVMGVGLSFQLLGTEGLAFAARNAAVPVASILVLIFSRDVPAAYFALIVGRMTIEVGDLIAGITAGDMAMAAFGGVFLIIEIAALVVLFPMLKKSV